MAKIALTLAAASFAAMTITAAAQGPSYESRGYGGPLGVGPNFQAGGQHSPPVYGGSSSSKKHRKKPTYQATKPQKERVRETETAKSTTKSSPAEAETENSSITAVGGQPGKSDIGKSVETAKGGVETENSSISSASLETATTSSDTSRTAAETKPKQNVGCKKYFPTAGMTLTVPCD
jgi:hypothetical protein